MITIRIDAHQHFWKLDRGDYDWITPDMVVLNKDYLPKDLEPNLKKFNMDRTIVVQAAPTVEETEYLLELYDHHEFIAGVVGWLEMDSLHFQEKFDRLRKHEGFVGVRPMIQDIDDDKWILRPKVRNNIAYLVEQGFPIDLLVLPKHLVFVHELLKDFPTLRGVINHAAKPNIKEQDFVRWREDIKTVSNFPNMVCKLSGLITEAKPNATSTDIKPVVEHVINCFGVDRVMFGSDWPVCCLAGTYEEVYQILLDTLPKTLSEQDKRKLFGDNAAEFYTIKEI